MLGQGTTSSVLACCARQSRRRFVLKVLEKDGVRDQAEMEALLRERSVLLQMLPHPNIVQVS